MERWRKDWRWPAGYASRRRPLLRSSGGSSWTGWRGGPESMTMQPDRPTRAEWWRVLALVCIALALRVGFVLFEPPGFYIENSLRYDLAALTFLDNGEV